MTIQPKQLVLKSVKQLLNYEFFIPAYQRGYRWSDVQVTQLLNDIWEFTKRDEKTKGEFYCLQPIVSKRRGDGKLEIIDGQQRLTTIFILLKYLEEIGKLLMSDFSIYSIHYATRKDSNDFLSNIKSKDSQSNNNIDFFFMKEAYNTIGKWFVDNSDNVNKLEFTNAIINHKIEDNTDEPIDAANNIRVIWYEIEETESNNSIDIFTRLNIGKIPLTNAELIKALLLQKGNFSEERVSLKQIQIASQWDAIEKTMQNDSFWFFIYNPTNSIKYDNRIEYIFDLMKGRTKESEYHHTFNEFYKDFSTCKKENKPDIDLIWLGIKRYFLTFEEWFNDYELFHYIGYLIDCGVPINTLKKDSENQLKNEFKSLYLVDQIKKQVDCNLDSIGYGDKQIKKVLLLFNIETILETQKSDMRFPFDRYKSENWDIEHVCSQTDKMINVNKRNDWVNDMLDFFINSTDLVEAKEYLQKLEDKADIQNDKLIPIFKSLLQLKKADKMEDELFEKCFESAREYFREHNQTEQRDDISNLALLDATTNRSYGNSFFPIKRKRIIMNDSKGVFVPIATKNLFLKYYSKHLSDIMYWSNDDAADYMESLKYALKKFLPK